MKFTADRRYADPEAAVRKLVEIANSIEPAQDGRNGLDPAIARGWLVLHESGTYVRLARIYSRDANQRPAWRRLPRSVESHIDPLIFAPDDVTGNLRAIRLEE